MEAVFRALRGAALRQFLGNHQRQQILLSSRPSTIARIQANFRSRPLSSRPIQRTVSLQTSRTFYRQSAQRRAFTSTSRCRRPSNTEPDDLSVPDAKLSLSQRLKKLSREYGWAALYVYLLLSALDFPFCFLAVKMLGTEMIGHWEHVVVGTVKGWLQWPMTQVVPAEVTEKVGDVLDELEQKAGLEGQQGGLLSNKQGEVVEHGVKEAQKANRGDDASIWTQLALAYAIHKSFIFVRVPLTAAVTPKIVKTLRGWGWNIGRPTSKAVKSGMQKVRGTGKDATGVNTKGTGVKPDD